MLQRIIYLTIYLYALSIIGPNVPMYAMHKPKVKVKSCYNPLRLGTVIVLVSSGIDFVNTPLLYSDQATR